MAKNVSKRVTKFMNKRSHALNTTKREQKLNLQTVKIDGKKVRLSSKEIKSLKKAA